MTSILVSIPIAALVETMSWCQTGNYALSEALLVYFTDAYMHHSALIFMCWINLRKHWWLNGRLQYLQCDSNGDTAVLHQAVDKIYLLFLSFFNIEMAEVIEIHVIYFIMDHPTVYIAIEYHQYQMRSPWLHPCILDAINECKFALRDTSMIIYGVQLVILTTTL